MKRRRPFYLYLLLLVACAIVFVRLIWNVNEPFTSYSDKHEPWYQDWHGRLKKGRKIILLYTTWFDHHQWNDIAGRRLYEEMERCPNAKNCLLTYDKSWITEAVAVVFHGRDVEENRNRYYSAGKLRTVRKKVPLAQKWIFLSHENPWNWAGYYKPYDGLFNWTATFSRKSDVFVPYHSYVPRLTSGKEERNYAQEKAGLIAWAVSNCRSRLRLNYVLQLQKYINVTVYGRCNCYFRNKSYCKHLDKGCQKEFSKYKFYLAFENDFCHDYITEKYWERLMQDSVPIVMGSNYDGLAVPGSYINTNNFKSIQELANYLIYLDNNDDEYNKYFAYKAQFVLEEAGLYCRICEKLNSDEAMQHSQVALSQRYNYERNCGGNKMQVENLQQQVDMSAKYDSLLVAVLSDIWCFFYRTFN